MTVERLAQPVPISAQEWPPDVTPVVSICCVTYNHAPFIRQCLDGFLMQETTFPVEILIHDDASTDETTAIIQEYEARFPHILQSVIQNANQYSQGISPLPTFLIPKARGRYIAVCEGDDYWTDPRKIQKQVDFLGSNPDYVITYHDAIIIDDSGKMLSESKLPPDAKRDFSAEELRRGAWTLTLTRCFRNVLTSFPVEYSKVVNRDIFFTVLLSEHGRGKYMSDIRPSAYRKHTGGIWSSTDTIEQQIQNLHTRIYIYHHLVEAGRDDAAKDFLIHSIIPYAFSMSPEKKALEGRIASLRKQIGEIHASRSFRVGHYLTRPFRMAAYLWRRS